MAVVVTGEPGIGKSGYAQYVSRLIDPGFNIDRIIFDIEEFFGSFEYWTPGSCFVLDEGGVDLDNQMWMTLFARMFKYVTETYRHRRLVGFFCLPNLNMFNVNQRRLVNGALHVYYRGRAGYSKFEGQADGSINDVPMVIVDAQQIPDSDPLMSLYLAKKEASNAILNQNAKLEVEIYKRVKAKSMGGGMFSTDRTKKLKQMLGGVEDEDEPEEPEEPGDPSGEDSNSPLY